MSQGQGLRDPTDVFGEVTPADVGRSQSDFDYGCDVAGANLSDFDPGGFSSHEGPAFSDDGSGPDVGGSSAAPADSQAASGDRCSVPVRDHGSPDAKASSPAKLVSPGFVTPPAVWCSGNNRALFRVSPRPPRCALTLQRGRPLVVQEAEVAP